MAKGFFYSEIQIPFDTKIRKSDEKYLTNFSQANAKELLISNTNDWWKSKKQNKKAIKGLNAIQMIHFGFQV